jgi:hypothetical protein
LFRTRGGDALDAEAVRAELALQEAEQQAGEGAADGVLAS